MAGRKHFAPHICQKWEPQSFAQLRELWLKDTLDKYIGTCLVNVIRFLASYLMSDSDLNPLLLQQ